MTDPQRPKGEEPGVQQPFSRRSFLKSTSAGAAAAAAAASASPLARANQASLSKEEQFLIDRITFGRSETMVTEMQARGYEGFLEWQLGLSDDTDANLFVDGIPALTGTDSFAKSAVEEIIHPWSLNPKQTFFDMTYPAAEPPGTVFTYPPPAGTAMGTYGPMSLQMGGRYGLHQLRWVMTDFLQNVHNTLLNAPLSYVFWVPFVRDVIYANALGNYPELVKQSGMGGSMMLYLGQPNSNKDFPNENYARELAELHTVGVKEFDLSDYSIPAISTFQESDILAFSRILTGWSIKGWNFATTGVLPDDLGEFAYNDEDHYYQDPATSGTQCDKEVSMTGGLPDFGAKCYDVPEPLGVREGTALISDLANHPLCALHLSRRLVQWFIGDDYEGTFRNVWYRTAMAYYFSGGDLKATIRELFNYAYISELCPAGSQENKVRRPQNKVQAFQRALDTSVDYTAPKPNRWLQQQLVMGQVNGHWPAPNGYQPENDKWTSTMLPTIQFYFDSIFGGTADAALLGAEDNALRIDDIYLDTVFPTGTSYTLGQQANEWLTGGCLLPDEVLAVDAALSTTGPIGDLRRWALFFTLVTPGYQYLC